MIILVWREINMYQVQQKLSGQNIELESIVISHKYFIKICGRVFFFVLNTSSDRASFDPKNVFKKIGFIRCQLLFITLFYTDK